MGDRATVALAVAACAGAWTAHPFPLAAVVVAVGLALLARRPALLVVAVALAASALGARAWDGLRPPATGPWSGRATLLGDPAEVAGALRVDVRIGGKRVEAWARGSAARALTDRLAGERVDLRGELQPVPADARARLARRHVAGRMTVEGAAFASTGDVPTRLANGCAAPWSAAPRSSVPAVGPCSPASSWATTAASDPRSPTTSRRPASRTSSSSPGRMLSKYGASLSPSARSRLHEGVE